MASRRKTSVGHSSKRKLGLHSTEWECSAGGTNSGTDTRQPQVKLDIRMSGWHAAANRASSLRSAPVGVRRSPWWHQLVIYTSTECRSPVGYFTPCVTCDLTRTPQFERRVAQATIDASSTTRGSLRLKAFRIHARLGQFHNVLQLPVDPQFNRKAVKVVVQAHTSRVSSEVLNRLGKAAVASRRDRRPVKGDAQVIAHGLHLLMISAFQPGQNSVPGEVVDPTLKGLRNFNAEFRCLMKNWRAWIRGEDVGPELCAGKFLADVHHEIDGFASFFRTLPREAENDIERRNHSGFYAALGRLVDIAQDLEILVHQLHHCGRGGLDALADLVQPGAPQQGQLVDAETRGQISGGLNTPLESTARANQAFRNLQRPFEVDQKVIVRHP